MRSAHATKYRAGKRNEAELHVRVAASGAVPNSSTSPPILKQPPLPLTVVGVLQRGVGADELKEVRSAHRGFLRKLHCAGWDDELDAQ